MIGSTIVCCLSLVRCDVICSPVVLLLLFTTSKYYCQYCHRNNARFKLYIVTLDSLASVSNNSKEGKKMYLFVNLRDKINTTESFDSDDFSDHGANLTGCARNIAPATNNKFLQLTNLPTHNDNKVSRRFIITSEENIGVRFTVQLRLCKHFVVDKGHKPFFSKGQ